MRKVMRDVIHVAMPRTAPCSPPLLQANCTNPNFHSGGTSPPRRLWTYHTPSTRLSAAARENLNLRKAA